MHINSVDYDAFLRPPNTKYCCGELCLLYRGVSDVDPASVLCALRRTYIDPKEEEFYPVRSCMLPLVIKSLSSLLQQRRETETKDVIEAVQRNALERDYDEWENLPEELRELQKVINANLLRMQEEMKKQNAE